MKIYYILQALCALSAIGQTVYANPVSSNLIENAAGWSLTGSGSRTKNTLTITGDGVGTSDWNYKIPDLKADTSYLISFQMLTLPGATGGATTCGFTSCNHDFGPAPVWQSWSFIVTTPDLVSDQTIHLGEWHIKGSVQFRKLIVHQVIPIETEISDDGGFRLGEGESVKGNHYSFSALYNSDDCNASRPLLSHTASFNTNRWVFTNGTEVLYRHGLSGTLQTSASLQLSVPYHFSGICVVSASGDSGRSWKEAGQMDRTGQFTFQLPVSLFPSKTILVRLQGEKDQSGAGASIQVDSYSYTSNLNRIFTAQSGYTDYLEIDHTTPGMQLNLENVRSDNDPTADSLQLTSTYHLRNPVTLTYNTNQGLLRTASWQSPAKTPLNIHPWKEVGTGKIDLHLSLLSGKRQLFSGSLSRYFPEYYAYNYGHLLGKSGGNILWWCRGIYKVFPQRTAPRSVLPIQFMAARRERQSVQVVLRPSHSGGTVQFSISNLIGPRHAEINASAFVFREVGYVNIERPTDYAGLPGPWPDPLPLLRNNWSPKPDRNNPVWIQLTVPSTATPGDYHGTLTIRFASSLFHTPVKVHVWNFALPIHTPLRSGFGIDPDNIFRYQRLTTPLQKNEVWDLYMQAFARNRINPYNPMQLAPYTITNSVVDGKQEIKLGFTDFDAAAHRYLDQLGFNAFTLWIDGLGSGDKPGSLMGLAEGTPEYKALMKQYGEELATHLQQRNWLKKAYFYQYDEPPDSTFPYMKRDMTVLHKVFPQLKRLLTVRITPKLAGDVDLWCPITPNFNPARTLEAEKAGQEVWWYVCTAPQGPYATLFIDHPAVDLRMWLWQTWKYGVNGILIWDTTYWTSAPEFPHNLENPWKNPMSYNGQSGVFGNGDGRLFYPPNRHPNQPGPAIIDGPVPSLRWEELGEGIEDWEYFYLLRQKVEKGEARGERSEELSEAKKLLTIPDSICADMTHFTRNPRLLYDYRERLARAIEKL